ERFLKLGAWQCFSSNRCKISVWPGRFIRGPWRQSYSKWPRLKARQMDVRGRRESEWARQGGIWLRKPRTPSEQAVQFRDRAKKRIWIRFVEKPLLTSGGHDCIVP